LVANRCNTLFKKHGRGFELTVHQAGGFGCRRRDGTPSSVAISLVKWIFVAALVVVLFVLLLFWWRDHGNESLYVELPSQDMIETGDILLSRCSDSSMLHRIRKAGTGSTWTHVAIFWRNPQTRVLYVLETAVRPTIRLMKLPTLLDISAGHVHVLHRSRRLTPAQLAVMDLEVLDVLWSGAQWSGHDLMLVPDAAHATYGPVIDVNTTGPLIEYDQIDWSRRNQAQACIIKRPLQSVVSWPTNKSIFCTDFVLAILQRLGDVPDDECVHCSEPAFFIDSVVIRKHYGDVYCIRNAIPGKTDNRTLLELLTEVTWRGRYTS